MWTGTGNHRHVELLREPLNLIIDIKVLPRPAAWGALVWFTGPTSFLKRLARHGVKKGVIKEPQELPTWLTSVVHMQGVSSEEDVFGKLRLEYTPPLSREDAFPPPLAHNMASY